MEEAHAAPEAVHDRCIVPVPTGPGGSRVLTEPRPGQFRCYAARGVRGCLLISIAGSPGRSAATPRAAQPVSAYLACVGLVGVPSVHPRRLASLYAGVPKGPSPQPRR